MERPVADVTCSAQVCARLEAILPSTSASAEDEVIYCSASHHDIAAVAAGQTISIVDVGTASVVAVLSGLHSSNIVKIAWSPESAAYGTAESWGQRLASVDELGKAVVWDVSTASPLTVCTSVVERRKHVQQANMVIDMAWGSSNNCLLVLLEPATFVMINADNGVVLRSQTITQGMVLTSIEVDSWQPSSVALTSMSQTLFTLRLGELPPSQGSIPQTDVARHEISTPGEGLTKVQWVPNRGLLLLMQLNQLSVYCIESKSTLTRMSLPAKYAPFSRWLAVQGSGTCLGTGDDGGANTLVCKHEGGAVSVWHDHEGNLKYTLHCYHRLQATIKSEALGLQSGILSLVPCIPRFLDTSDRPATSSRPVTGAANMMWLLAVMSGGQLWRWRLPLPVPGQSFESLCLSGADTEPRLDLTKTSQSIESLIKLSPSMELLEAPQDSRALLAHSQSLGRRRGSMRDLSGALTASAHTAPLASTNDASGPLTAPPRKFLVDSSKKSPGASSAREDVARTPSPMGRIDEQTEPPRTPEQLEQPGLQAATTKPSADAAVGSSGAAAGSAPPSLEALQCGLPAGATALAVFPALVPAGDVPVYSRTNSRSGPGDVPSGTHSRQGSMGDEVEPDTPPQQGAVNLTGGADQESVSLLAVGTAEGTVEVVSVSQGALQPLALNIVHSFKVAASKVLSVHWLGTTLRFAAMTCTAVGKPENQKYTYTVSVTDLVTTKTVALLREAEASEPLISLRTDPNGRYLAIMPRSGGLQVWCVPVMGKAVKVRTVELPFVAMAWVYPTPQESGPSPIFSAEMEAVAWPAHYKRQAASRQSSGNGSLQNGGTPGGGTPPKSAHDPAEAQAAFCFAVSDGRLGSITVTDRGVKKRPVTAPHWTVQYVDRLVVTCIAAMGDLVFIGDSEGVLYQWNTVSGQTMVVPAGRRVIRKIAVGPPVPAALRTGQGVGAGLARLVLLYGDGALGVWDVHDASSLEGGRCEGVDKVKLPKFSDAIWVPLPAPLSGGCVTAAISKNSGVSLLDLVDTGVNLDGSDRRKALQRLVRGERQRVSGSHEGANELMGSPLTSRQAMHLAPARTCHSMRLMPPTVVTFLRLVFEAGVPVLTLVTMGGGRVAERLAAAKSLCRFVLRIPRGASDNDQERTPPPASPPALDGGGLVPVPEAPALDATALLRSPHRGEALDATGLLPGRDAEQCAASAALPAVELHDAQAVLQAIDMQSLVHLVQRISVLRTGDPATLLLPHEAAAYTAALESSNPRERACRCIAFAAALVGCGAEARFWTHLHATLAAHDARGSSHSHAKSVTLFPYSAAAADAQRRVRWHEQVSGDLVSAEWVSVGANPLSDRRMLEYVAIGDYASAAALMMTEAPAVSGTFYRNSVLSIALAGVAASVSKDKAPSKGVSSPGRGFQVQTLKVVAEHAREIGDMTMCVVLLCAAGRYAEAVAELQAMDDWQAALSLAERFLSVPERNALLHARAKAHNRQFSNSEGIWRTVGLFTAAGSLRSAAAVLRTAGLTAAACNFTRICTEMGLICSVAPGSALEGALPESARAKIANPGKRSWLEGGDMTKRSNGLLRSSRGGEALADTGAMLGWVNDGGTWIKESAGEMGQEGLHPEAAVLVNFDAPEPAGGGEPDESVRKMHGEVIQDADRIAQMLSDQRQHVLYVLMELCKSRVW